jgi:hypothetical protein
MNALIANGNRVSDDASKVCILFDPKDGRVVHVHGVTNLNSGKQLDLTDMEVRTRKQAEHFGKSTAGLRVLHVPINAIRARGAFRVNESGDGLVTVTRRPRWPGQQGT